MCEYQYYEFQAIDGSLTEREIGELRAYSTRALITSTSFINEYSWGNFKGDEDAWMERYFDAFLYLANWGTHIVQFRIPAKLLDLETAKAYCSGESASVRSKGGKIVLKFISENDTGEDWVDGSGQLASLIGVRDGLLRGDLRALYLGWLLLAQTGELEDEEVEPPVPAGLGELSASLDGFAEFLRLDRDLLQVATMASRPLKEKNLDPTVVRGWVRRLGAMEKDDLITGLVLDRDVNAVRVLQQRFLRDESVGPEVDTTGSRTVATLLQLTETRAAERARAKAESSARAKAIREQEVAIAREAHLDSLVGQEPRLWAQAEAMADTKQPKKYDQAVQILADLRDMGFRNKAGDFKERLETFCRRHCQKPALIRRIRLAGL